MFEKRVRIILLLFVMGWFLLVARLVQLQVLQAEQLQDRTDRLLTHVPKPLKPVRGKIRDRHGRVLAYDEPAWSVSLHYGLLKRDGEGSERYLDTLLHRAIRSIEGLSDEDKTRLRQRMRAHIAWLWQSLGDFSEGVSIQDLQQRAAEVCKRIDRWKQGYSRRRGLDPEDARIAEEDECHALIHNLDNEQRIRAERLLLERFRWLYEYGAVAVTDDSRRRYVDDSCVSHVLGNMREVNIAEIEARPFSAEDRGGYKPGDRIGDSGVEKVGEDQLRGRRGRFVTYRDDRLPDRLDAQAGRDVYLTLDFELQSNIFEFLGEHVQAHPDIPGGSVVVVDVPSRELLALVSYPSYDPNRFREDYSKLRVDTVGRPTQFKAVNAQYAPGSIVKPVTITAGHATGELDMHTTFICEGHLIPGNPDSPSCWIPANRKSPNRHGEINSREAIKYSCNVFCYKVGSELGVNRLTNWLGMFGVGEKTGTGLPEEREGILPTSSFLAEHRERPVRRGDARNYAIGQGEIEITPVQAARIVASYASAVFAPLRLIRSDLPLETRRVRNLDEAIWRRIRLGMYEVVNEPGGTATEYARLKHPQYVLCGKSGSAETNRFRTKFRVDFTEPTGGHPDFEIVQANTYPLARDEFKRLYPEHADHILDVTPVSFWPTKELEDGRRHSHAWFVAFLQKKGADGQPDWNVPARVAIAVLLEFGGSGGRESGTLCRKVAKLLVQRFPQYVDPNMQLAGGGR